MCGIGAVVSLTNPELNVLPDLLQILLQMQNRGRDAAGFGLIGLVGKPNLQWKKVGPAEEHFAPSEVGHILDKFSGSRPIATGHVRYTTAPGRDADNAQPHHFGVGGQRFVVAANGDIPFCDCERTELTKLGYQFESDCDAEVIAKWLGHTWLHNGYDEEKAFQQIGQTLSGAFSLVAITPSKRLFIMRDPIGFRPLWYAIDKSAGLFYVASESAILQKITGSIPSEVLPGELIVVNPFATTTEQIKKYRFANDRPQRFCLMEIYYFSRPDSFHSEKDLRTMHELRLALGHQLGKEWQAGGYPKPDLVCPVPNSGTPSAQGLANELGIPYMEAIFKDRYAGRIFLDPATERANRVFTNLSVIAGYVKGKKVAVTDDSIVRGDQSIDVTRKLYTAGAAEVYWLSTAPPYCHPCFFGINTPDPERLIAHGHSVEEIRQIIQVDKLLYLSLEGTFEVMRHTNLCTACFTGNYPIPVPSIGRKEV